MKKARALPWTRWRQDLQTSIYLIIVISRF